MMEFPMRVFITGSSGFIGFHLAGRLLAKGASVTGYDGLTPYYDVRLKLARNELLARYPTFCFVQGMLENRAALEQAVRATAPDVIIHLAAQAGVRYSLENPRAYLDSNLIGSFNLLEIAREVRPRHLLMASTSSVYGANTRMPFSEGDKADHPMSLYAATKKAMEAMAHADAHLWRVPITCFRFFTVYGPWGRPDMALFKFVDAILHDRPIEIYGNGQMRRDFTYIDDLIEAIIRLIDQVPGERPSISADADACDAPSAGADSLSPVAPWRVVNIGGGHPVDILRFIEVIEHTLGRTAIRTYLPMQPGDVSETVADPRLLEMLTGYRPTTSVEVGVTAFIKWYREYYRAQGAERDTGGDT